MLCYITKVILLLTKLNLFSPLKIVFIIHIIFNKFKKKCIKFIFKKQFSIVKLFMLKLFYLFYFLRYTYNFIASIIQNIFLSFPNFYLIIFKTNLYFLILFVWIIHIKSYNNFVENISIFYLTLISWFEENQSNVYKNK